MTDSSSPAPLTCTPLLDRLALHSRQSPNKIAATFLAPGADGGSVQRQLTYSELDHVTSRLADRLTAREGLKPGDRAVLVYPPSLDFMVAFLACLKARIVAVPVFPPHPSRRDSLGMFGTICEACQARYALTNAEYNHAKKLVGLKDAFTLSKGKSALWPDLKWIVADDDKKQSGPTKSEGDAKSAAPKSSPDDVAFLQFTSGSTSDPKGVMITYGNLAHNLTLITSELSASTDTVVVSWLPQYHDMGLIGSYLGVLYCGGTGYYMSPLSFLQRPMLWIEAVSKYRATHLQAPNFAFKLTARKLAPSEYGGSSKSTLDLSSVRHIINAAEPVDAAALDAFYAAFGPFGLPPNVIFPTYGLAEHTVFVCSNGRARLTVDKEQLEGHGRVVAVAAGADNATTRKAANAVTRLVGCGKPPPSVTVKIVDAETRTMCEDAVVGEIWIDSPSKAAGYYLKPTETKEDFHASIANDEGSLARSGGYLRTGDLGFFHDGELLICGRRKDLIIVGGRNYYPQDIEATAEAASEAIRPGCSAAFSIDSASSDGGEQVVLVMELKEVPKASSQVETVCSALALQVRAAVTQEHSLGVSVLCFLQTRTVPKTSSGKIARAWCRKGYLNGTLNVVYQRSFAASDVSPLEIEAADDGAATKVSDVNGAMKPSDIAALRSMDRADILAKLKLDVSRAASLPVESVDKDTALATMLDSLTLSQLKGLLENSYAVKISDEYLFRESTTLQKLVDVVKLGYAPDDIDANSSGANAPATTQHAAAAPGRATGLAGALGCPPGVVCSIL